MSISVSEDKEREEAYFYVLDEKDRNIIYVHYESYLNFAGREFIKDIIRTLVVDDEAPILEEIYFEPSSASPGEVVQLIVRVRDDLSGIDMESFGQSNIPVPWIYGFKPSIFPYISVMNVLDDNLGINYLQGVRGLTTGFTPIGYNQYSYPIILPLTAPGQKISLTKLFLRDRDGNMVAYTLDYQFSPSHDRNDYSKSTGHYEILDKGEEKYNRLFTNKVGLNSIDTVVKTDLSMAVLEINNSSDNGDNTPPKLIDAYFDKTLVFKENSNLKLHLKVEDNTGIDDTQILLNSACYGSKSVGDLMTYKWVGDENLSYVQKIIYNQIWWLRDYYSLIFIDHQ